MQKTIGNCTLFLQFSSLRLALAALADKSFISSSMVIIFSRFFHTAFKFCCISMRHETKFLKMLPALAGEHYFDNRPKGISHQKLLFGTCSTLLATTKSPLALSKKHTKTNGFLTFSLFGPINPFHIAIFLAI